MAALCCCCLDLVYTASSGITTCMVRTTYIHDPSRYNGYQCVCRYLVAYSACYPHQHQHHTLIPLSSLSHTHTHTHTRTHAHAHSLTHSLTHCSYLGTYCVYIVGVHPLTTLQEAQFCDVADALVQPDLVSRYPTPTADAVSAAWLPFRFWP
ncbi:hypothetical protein F5B17DRAFT_35138 [Nemania serpens]|nr:hypothetical protein F5B17DRAFT_35138 [Nemania serpens]